MVNGKGMIYPFTIYYLPFTPFGAKRRMIIGICGGTGSGKTTVANRILESVSQDEVVFMQQDSYYRDLDQMPLDYRSKVNFDHPDAIDNDLLVEHVRALKRGEAVELPLYDFKTHSDRKSTRLNSVTPISRMPSSA